MKPERVIQLLEVEKEYRLKQTGHSQQPINKEVRQRLDIAIEAVKLQSSIIRCKDCRRYLYRSARCILTDSLRMENEFCSRAER